MPHFPSGGDWCLVVPLVFKAYLEDSHQGRKTP
jgi:hypothetical protein